ncbi:MAG: pentapeptide repeat-containing protein, partial [Candidatus Omnitrophica bacterium]|nr:pentapeptide repeat-containing protein [Candidatus Omnitrophota bacterium]
LAYEKGAVTIDGVPLLPEHIQKINQSKIFEIVVHNLLHRDMNIGPLNASKRLLYLRNFALYLQRRRHSSFASPEEIRNLVQEIFSDDLRKTDTPEQTQESYYRTCRRHSGLTTEGQFRDTSGIIDMPIDELDTESRVGFSHNSLREYLVADSISDFLESGHSYPFLDEVVISDLIGDFFIGITEYKKVLIGKLSEKFKASENQKIKDVLFKLIYYFIRSDQDGYISLLGKIPSVSNLDISGYDFSGLPLRNAEITDCLALDTDFRKSDLKNTSFRNTVLENVMFDDALLSDADFTRSEIVSIYVFDGYDSGTLAILKGKNARQWLFSHGAKVSPVNDLNPYMGKPWYEAAREVTRTLEQRIAGGHQ